MRVIIQMVSIALSGEKKVDFSLDSESSQEK
jgi:hypothetical protein